MAVEYSTKVGHLFARNRLPCIYVKNKVRKDAQYVKVELEIELDREEIWNRNFRMNEQHRKYSFI